MKCTQETWTARGMVECRSALTVTGCLVCAFVYSSVTGTNDPYLPRSWRFMPSINAWYDSQSTEDSHMMSVPLLLPPVIYETHEKSFDTVKRRKIFEA